MSDLGKTTLFYESDGTQPGSGWDFFTATQDMFIYGLEIAWMDPNGGLTDDIRIDASIGGTLCTGIGLSLAPRELNARFVTNNIFFPSGTHLIGRSSNLSNFPICTISFTYSPTAPLSNFLSYSQISGGPISTDQNFPTLITPASPIEIPTQIASIIFYNNSSSIEYAVISLNGVAIQVIGITPYGMVTLGSTNATQYGVPFLKFLSASDTLKAWATASTVYFYASYIEGVDKA